jgi:hypothetical protein
MNNKQMNKKIERTGVRFAAGVKDSRLCKARSADILSSGDKGDKGDFPAVSAVGLFS